MSRARDIGVEALAQSAGASVNRVQMQNRRGEWVAAIPLPIFRLWLKECPECRERFYTTEGYRGHYALRHVLDPRDDA